MYLKTAMLLAILLATQVSHSYASTCVDDDGDGWGWNGSGSCRISGSCVDNDGINDGWGWDGTNSCELNITPALTACIDHDGDGWGWNGRNSCDATTDCMDADGDGWGWNGIESCIPTENPFTRITNFESFPPYSLKIAKLGEHYYGRFFEKAGLWESSVWQLSATTSHSRIAGPSIPLIPDPIGITTLDDNVIWGTATSGGKLKLHRLDLNEENTEICTDGRMDNNSCNPSTLGTLSFVTTSDNHIVVYDFAEGSARIIDTNAVDARPLTAINGEPLLIYYISDEVGGNIYAAGNQDPNNRNYGVWRADSMLQQFEPVTHPDENSFSGGITNSDKYIVYNNGAEQYPYSPSIYHTSKNSNTLTKLEVNSSEYINLIDATNNRIFYAVGESKQLASMDLSTGDEIRYAVQGVSLQPITFDNELIFQICTGADSDPCLSTSLYATQNDGTQIKKIATNVERQIKANATHIFFVKNQMLYKFNGSLNPIRVNTHPVTVDSILYDTEGGIFIRGFDDIHGDEVWLLQ